MTSHAKPNNHRETADVCLILEGTYPYVRGGVSGWTHDLITHQSHLTFHLICILPPGTEAPTPIYDLPPNVLSVTDVVLGRIPDGRGHPGRNVLKRLHPHLEQLSGTQASFDHLQQILAILHADKDISSEEYLLNSKDTWQVIEQMYEAYYHDSSMLDYFWSWRALFGSVFSVMLCRLPDAGVYHTLCTGYAGLLAARAKAEKDKPVIVTEHGIYTNERRIEIASAKWLEETATSQLTIDTLRSDLRDLWMHAFSNYSRICYEASDRILTLFAGNQEAQRNDGAAEDKLALIPNGVDVKRFGALSRKSHDVPTIAMIGRVVPIKDVKSFLRACAMMRDTLGELKAYIMGNLEEDPEYVAECQELAAHLLLDDVVEFTGAVRVDDYLPKIDVVVFTSVSEAQPLVILEAGAAGIPVVATRVGACEEMIMGTEDELPPLGAGGAAVPLANPSAVAAETLKLLTDKAWYEECANALRTRVHRDYTKTQQQDAYRGLYASLMEKEHV